MICSFCKEEIMGGAIKCKHCGSMIDSTRLSKNSESAQLKASNKRSRKIEFIGVGVFIAIMVMTLTATSFNFFENEADIQDKFGMTIRDMKSLGTALEVYTLDNDIVPQVEKLEDLNAPFFVPFYIKEVPLKDAWGNNYLFVHGLIGTSSQDTYSIASSGSDGRFEGFNQTGIYTDLNYKDIIFSNGKFIYSPETYQAWRKK